MAKETTQRIFVRIGKSTRLLSIPMSMFNKALNLIDRNERMGSQQARITIGKLKVDELTLPDASDPRFDTSGREDDLKYPKFRI